MVKIGRQLEVGEGTGRINDGEEKENKGKNIKINWESRHQGA